MDYKQYSDWVKEKQSFQELGSDVRVCRAAMGLLAEWEEYSRDANRSELSDVLFWVTELNNNMRFLTPKYEILVGKCLFARKSTYGFPTAKVTIMICDRVEKITRAEAIRPVKKKAEDIVYINQHLSFLIEVIRRECSVQGLSFESLCQYNYDKLTEREAK